jgi:hypothetical protein
MWRAVRHRVRFERDMDDELAFHLDQRIDAHVRNGLSRDEAARTARLEFGNPEVWQDRCREARGLGLVDALRTDVQFGWRSIRKNVLLSATVVSTLALGIGANTAMFSVLHSVLNPVSYPEADRLVFLNCRATIPNRPARVMGWSYPKFVDLAAMTTSFEAVAAVGGWTSTSRLEETPNASAARSSAPTTFPRWEWVRSSARCCCPTIRQRQPPLRSANRCGGGDSARIPQSSEPESI